MIRSNKIEQGNGQIIASFACLPNVPNSETILLPHILAVFFKPTDSECMLTDIIRSYSHKIVSYLYFQRNTQAQ